MGRRIAAVPGVRAVAPVLGAQFYLARGDSAGEPLFTSGIDPQSQFLYRIVDGRQPGAGEVAVSEPLARDEGLKVGDTIRLAADLDVSLGRARQTTAYRVSGMADFLYDYEDQRSLAMPIGEVQRLTGRPGEVSLFGVATDEGVDDDALADRITAAVPEVSTYSTRELMAEMDRRLLYFQQLATILGSIALVVTALLVSTIITIGVREKFGEIATLRAIGVEPRAGAAGDRGGGAGAGGDRVPAGAAAGAVDGGAAGPHPPGLSRHPGEDDLLCLGARPRAPGDEHRDPRRRARRPAARLERGRARRWAVRCGRRRSEGEARPPVARAKKAPG